MESALQLLAAVAIVLGTTFSVLGTLGVVRMPDVYTRLHATGKIGVFGAVLLLLGVVLLLPKAAGKAIVLIFFLLLAGPVTAHSLSSAAYRIGIPFAKPMRNDLAAVTETFDLDAQAEPQRKA